MTTSFHLLALVFVPVAVQVRDDADRAVPTEDDRVIKVEAVMPQRGLKQRAAGFKKRTCLDETTGVLDVGRSLRCAYGGKTYRRLHDAGQGLGPLHIVNAWASEEKRMLGQRSHSIRCMEPSSRIDAIRKLGSLIDLLLKKPLHTGLLPLETAREGAGSGAPIRGPEIPVREFRWGSASQ